MNQEIKSYSLRQLLSSVRRCITETYTGSYWVRAEASDVRLSGGHLYMELLEKGIHGEIVAKVRANLWRQRYQQVAQRFDQAGLGSLQSGMSLLLLVRITMDEVFGLSLNIEDIDPTYALGEIARLRQETIKRLQRDGVFNLNKTLSLSLPIQHIAIVSSASAAGYGDFMRHLRDNRYALCYYTALFTAKMQGDGTTESVIDALERILQTGVHFDAVVIIRGGGSVSELRAFDSYDLCSYCAQYPLPIISGIGHERDEVVLDLIANVSQKTPTAVADFIVQTLEEEYLQILHLQERLEQSSQNRLGNLTIYLDLLIRQFQTSPTQKLLLYQNRQNLREGRLISSSQKQIHQGLQQTNRLKHLLPYASQQILKQERINVQQKATYLPILCKQLVERMQTKLEAQKQAIKLSSPETILRRGFAIVESKNKIITKSSELHQGDTLRLRLGDSIIDTEIKSISQS